MIGTTLGHYRIIRQLGRGGMGEVYRAHDARLKRDVALKILPEELASDPERLARFEREATSVAALDHPNIVTVFSVEQADTDEGGHVHFMTMQLVEGKALSELISRSGFPLDRLLDLAIPLADAISTAHEHGIVHRDLKPSNIMVSDDGRVRVLDFGLAKLREEALAPEEMSELPTVRASEFHTEEGKILGTVAYMSPEQAEGKLLDHRTDVFSLGIILHEMATGERPFKGDTKVSMLSSIIKDTPASVTDLNRALPRHLGRIIKHALEKARERRFQTAKDFRNELTELRAEVGSGDSPAAARGSRVTVGRLLAGAVVVAAAGALFLMDRGGLWDRLAGEAAPRIASVAVLPFDSRSSDSNQEFLAEGIAEALTAELTKIRTLKVGAWRSAMRYRDPDLQLAEIADELDVEAVVVGSVTQVAGRTLVAAQLVHAATDQQLWADYYDRDSQDTLDLMSEVARDIAAGIEVNLTTREETLLAGSGPIDPEAIEAFFRGNYYSNRASVDGWRRSVDYYERAIEIEPRYAPGHAALALSSALLPIYSGGAPAEYFPQAREAAQTALDLDDTLAKAHSALGLVEHFHDWDWSAAERAFQRAIEVEPSSADAHLWYAGYLTWIGRGEDAVAVGRHALELDPLWPPMNMWIGALLFHARRYNESIEQLQKALEMTPNLGEAYNYLFFSYVKVRQYENALATLENMRHQFVPPARREFMYAFLHASTGNRDEAMRMLNAPPATGRPDWLSWARAVVYGSLGEMDEAFLFLDRAYERRELPLAVAKDDPRLDPLRDDPRFRDFLRRMNFPE